MKKKLRIKTRFGWVVVPRGHILSESGGGFFISPYLQEIQCEFGRDETYQSGSCKIERFFHIPMDKKQLERVTRHYGDLVGEGLSAPESDLPIVFDDEANVYCMVDGSMILTRTDEWKEVKLGRLFESKSHHELSPGRNWIRDSTYVAHLGKYDGFLEKLEPLTDRYDGNLVFVCDGASWIWNWVGANYPGSTQILDYYHAVENLSKLVGLAFRDKAGGKAWREIQAGLIADGKVDQLITNVEALNCTGKKAIAEQERLANYYRNHKERMQYPEFRKRGLLIGSGPIEAAHRTVIQRRLKLSGQRWTIQGAQQVLNLRVANMSGHWSKVVDLIGRQKRA